MIPKKPSGDEKCSRGEIDVGDTTACNNHGPLPAHLHILRPALRVTDMAVYGSLTGAVAEALVTEMGPAEPAPDTPSIACTNGELHDTGNAVYLYEGEVTDPLDIRGVDTDPAVTATVTQNAEGVYEFAISYLSVGSYTAAFTCQASGDDPEVEDEIVFGAIINDVVIADGETTHIEFAAPTPAP